MLVGSGVVAVLSTLLWFAMERWDVRRERMSVGESIGTAHREVEHQVIPATPDSVSENDLVELINEVDANLSSSRPSDLSEASDIEAISKDLHALLESIAHSQGRARRRIDTTTAALLLEAQILHVSKELLQAHSLRSDLVDHVIGLKSHTSITKFEPLNIETFGFLLTVVKNALLRKDKESSGTNDVLARH